MPTPPSSGVALRCAERWYESLHATFAAPAGKFRIFLPLLIGPGWSELVTYEGTNCQSSRLPPNGTKPDHIGLTATADARGSARPTIVSAHSPILLLLLIIIITSLLLLFQEERVLTSKIRDRPQSNTINEPLGGRKRGPDRVMGLGWGFMGSTHHTARTVGYSGESCTRRSNGFPREV